MSLPLYPIGRSARTTSPRSCSLFLAVIGATALLSTTTATAASARGENMSDATAQYQREKAVCMSGQSNQDKATCLREAGAAYQQARQGKLNDSRQASYQQNALERCKALPAADQPACQRRIENPEDVEGSATAGGVLRKDVLIVPAGTQ